MRHLALVEGRRDDQALDGESCGQPERMLRPQQLAEQVGHITPVCEEAGEGIRCQGNHQSRRRLVGSRLVGSRLAGSRLAGSRWAGSRLAGCRLAGSRLAGSLPVAAQDELHALLQRTLPGGNGGAA